MSKIAVVYWSGTGNTEEMAKLITQGAIESDAEVAVFTASEFSESMVNDFDKIAFGCPSMGAEVLEEEVFEPMFESVEKSLKEKKIALFGSYGWGDGQWMCDWEKRCKTAGADVYNDKGLIVNEAPTGADCDLCKQFGSGFVNS